MRPLRGIGRTFAGGAEMESHPPPREILNGFLSATGLRPIDQASETDVFIVGYPKSGNTWMQYLVTGAFCGVDLELVSDALVQDLAPDVHFKKFFKPWFPVTFFKSHFLPREEYRNVVYLLRDGRDAMVSYWHYLEGLTGKPLDFLELVEGGQELFPCKWHEHVQQWLANPFNARMIVVRYEDLKKDSVAQLRRIAEFAGLECSDAALERAAHGASFQSMKKHQTAFPWENPQIPGDRPFVRRGEIGSHKDEMAAAVLDAFLREAAPAMRQGGYLP